MRAAASFICVSQGGRHWEVMEPDACNWKAERGQVSNLLTTLEGWALCRSWQLGDHAEFLRKKL